MWGFKKPFPGLRYQQNLVILKRVQVAMSCLACQIDPLASNLDAEDTNEFDADDLPMP